MGLLLGAPLTLLVAIARLGQDVGVLDDAAVSDIVLLAILVSVILPVAFKSLFGEEKASA